MAMNRLFPELVEHILGMLPPLDLLNSARVCSSWAEVASSSPSLKEVWLCLRDPYVTEAMATVINSRRRYRNLRIVGVDWLHYDAGFWMKVGAHLRRLDLMECNIGPGVFYPILRHCTALESLGLSDETKGNISFVTLKHARSICPPAARESLRNVRNLYLNLVDLTPDMLAFLLEVMPRVTSLTMPKRIRKHVRFGSCLLRTEQEFTKLDLRMAVYDEDLIAIARMCSESLQDLRLNCSELTPAAHAALADCTRLRHLSLICARTFEDDHLANLIRKAPDLETLNLDACDSLSDEGVGQIPSLKKLRNLQVTRCSRVIGAALFGSGMVPDIWNVHSLKNLRSLYLSEVISHEVFDMICENLLELEVLELGDCAEVTEAHCLKLRRLEKLKSFSMIRGLGLTDITLERGLGSSAMESLDVDGSPLTDDGLASLAAQHGRLKNLCLSNCGRITDAGLAVLLRCEPDLEFLALGFCSSLRDACLVELKKWCPRLRHLLLCDGLFRLEAVRGFRSRTGVDVKGSDTFVSDRIRSLPIRAERSKMRTW